jgi:ABC-type lipoprotein release transport system permease subunit
MTSEIIVAILGLAGTLAGSFLGVVTASKVTDYRLKALETQVSKHNQIVERTYILEGQMHEVRQDIEELKARSLT